MAYISTLGSPGIEVIEKDNSLRISSSSGTTVFVPGYAPQGPVEEINTISSISDFENIYGVPTNAAERYFYYTVLALLNNSGSSTTVLTSRLPYGENSGDTVSTAFSLLAYPAIPVAYKELRFNGDKNIYTYPVFELTDRLKNSLGINSLTFTDITEPVKVSKVSVDKANIVLSSEYQNIVFTNIKYIGSLAPSKYTFELQLKLSGIVFTDVANTLSLDGKIIGLINDEVITIECTLEALNSANSSNLYGVLKIDDNVLGTMSIDMTYESDLAELPSNDSLILNFGSFDTGQMTPGISCSIPYGNLDKDGNIVPFSLVNNNLCFDGTFVNEDGITIDALTEQGSDKRTYIDNITYMVGTPLTYQISLSEYYELLNGELFTWSNKPFNNESNNNVLDAISRSAFIVINTSRAIINDSFEGYYFGLTDNIFNEPSDDRTFNAIKSLKITTKTSTDNSGLYDLYENSDFTTMSEDRLDFYLDSDNVGSLSHLLQTECVSFDTSSKMYDDTLSLALLKMGKSSTSSQALKLSYQSVEKYNVSLGKTRVQGDISSTNPVTYFAENVVKNSNNISILVNPYISKTIGIDINGLLKGKVRIVSDKLRSNLVLLENKYLKTSFNIAANDNIPLSDKIATRNNSLANYSTLYQSSGIDLYEYKQMFGDVDTEPGQIGDRFIELDSVYPLGVYTVTAASNKLIGNTPDKISRALSLISNDEEYPDIDILVEAGLGTIYTYANSKKTANISSIFDSSAADEINGIFDETLILQGVEDLRSGGTSVTGDAEDVINDFMAVQQSFLSLANSYVNGGRNDTFYLADTLRGILLKGKNTKVETLYGSKLNNNAYDDTTVVNHSWSTSIYYPHKHLFDTFVSSYASVHAQWGKISDSFSGENVWLPLSGYIAALMCSSDVSKGRWYASAGYNRGIINNLLDVAVNPDIKRRTDLYKICINSVPKMSGVGIVNWGIRTMSKVASAMDQNTCRRTFLDIIKTVKKYLRYYVFEPNNEFTRLSCYNDLQPYLQNKKIEGAIYSYTLVCDTSNNTTDVINNGEMAVDISASPTRTGENIVLTMTANKYTGEITTATFNAE